MFTISVNLRFSLSLLFSLVLQNQLKLSHGIPQSYFPEIGYLLYLSNLSELDIQLPLKLT